MENEVNKTKKISKLAIFSFILSLVPILLIIFYGVIRNLLFSSPLVYMLWYNLLVEVIPFISLVFSFVVVIIIKTKKLKGMGFAITGFLISLIEAILFLTIIMNIMG